MFQSKPEEISKEKRRKSFIPILNLMSPRGPATTPIFQHKDSTTVKNTQHPTTTRLGLTEALQKDSIPIGSEIIILTEEELNLFKSLNIFRSKHKIPLVQGELKVQDTVQRKKTIFKKINFFFRKSFSSSHRQKKKS